MILAEVSLKCFSCGLVHKLERVGFRQACDCGEDMHVCLNCKFYDLKSYNECREPSAERIQAKDRSNLCDFFSASSEGSGDGGKNEREELLKAAEALCKS